MTEERGGGAAEGLVRRIAAVADGKQAADLIALDVSGLVSYTDFLLICTARNDRHAKAIADEVRVEMKRDGRLPGRVEGEREARWIVLDYLDCVLHVFVPEMRGRYRLESLWGEAPRLELGVEGELSPDAVRRGA